MSFFPHARLNHGLGLGRCNCDTLVGDVFVPPTGQQLSVGRLVSIDVCATLEEASKVFQLAADAAACMDRPFFSVSIEEISVISS